MEIHRVDGYEDSRFSKKVLDQHGCFLVDGTLCEVEIVSAVEAVIRGCPEKAWEDLIAEFQEYAPQITTFYDREGGRIQKTEPREVFSVSLDEIQPAQVYLDADKLEEVGRFIQKPEDVVIQVVERGGRFFCVDGHTRLYCAHQRGFRRVLAVKVDSGEYVHDFAQEAQSRGIHSPKDLIVLEHGEYEKQWYSYCDSYFAKRNSGDGC